MISIIRKIVTIVYRDPFIANEAKFSDFVVNQWEITHTKPFFKILISYILFISSVMNLKILYLTFSSPVKLKSPSCKSI